MLILVMDILVKMNFMDSALLKIFGAQLNVLLHLQMMTIYMLFSRLIVHNNSEASDFWPKFVPEVFLIRSGNISMFTTKNVK